ncbi:MAG: methyltransferase domain-containing protein, partial [Armatimonadetes bacterium]|nr:methyltransferase domain-containing protein [Armatimonadota bacterium]NIO75721.1 methyltransferase domain-containing protein [Armatimonadota bacterium]NIO96947.1 methyltransferase domain-containing protein [Armatimonadota bacterium]
LKLDTTTVEDHQRCIDLCNNSGISIAASYMVGNPGETEEDLRLTYDFIVRNKGKAKVEGFYLLTPLPGTPVWDACLQEGIVSEEMDWSSLNLAFDNPDFRWGHFVYANRTMPRRDFVESVRNHGLLLGGDLKLEIGSGESPEPGFLHLDIRSGPHIEYVTDARRLPFPDGTVTEIYSRHNLEHFTFAEAREVLQECLRILKPGGKIYLIVPNMEFHIEQYYAADQKHAQAGFWGWQRNPFDVHKWGYWWESLHNLLASVGFAQIENLTGREDSRHNSLMHLEVRAHKPRRHESPSQPISTASKVPFVMRSEHERTQERIRQLEEEITARDAFIEQLCGRS